MSSDASLADKLLALAEPSPDFALGPIDRGRRDVLVIDFGHVWWRAWHTRSDGDGRGAVEAAVSRVVELGIGWPRVILAVDSPPYDREKLYSEYKSSRTRDEAGHAGIAVALRRLRAEGHVVAGYAGAEADDVCATFARQAPDRVCVATGDKDLWVLAGVAAVHDLDKGRVTEALCRERFGAHPDQVSDLLALAGDAGDDVPGVPKIGIASAARLLRAFDGRAVAGMPARLGTLDDALAERPRTIVEVATARAELDTLKRAAARAAKQESAAAVEAALADESRRQAVYSTLSKSVPQATMNVDTLAEKIAVWSLVARVHEHRALVDLSRELVRLRDVPLDLRDFVGEGSIARDSGLDSGDAKCQSAGRGAARLDEPVTAPDLKNKHDDTQAPTAPIAGELIMTMFDTFAGLGTPASSTPAVPQPIAAPPASVQPAPVAQPIGPSPADVFAARERFLAAERAARGEMACVTCRQVIPAGMAMSNPADGSVWHMIVPTPHAAWTVPPQAPVAPPVLVQQSQPVQPIVQIAPAAAPTVTTGDWVSPPSVARAEAAASNTPAPAASTFGALAGLGQPSQQPSPFFPTVAQPQAPPVGWPLGAPAPAPQAVLPFAPTAVTPPDAPPSVAPSNAIALPPGVVVSPAVAAAAAQHAAAGVPVGFAEVVSIEERLRASTAAIGTPAVAGVSVMPPAIDLAGTTGATAQNATTVSIGQAVAPAGSINLGTINLGTNEHARVEPAPAKRPRGGRKAAQPSAQITPAGEDEPLVLLEGCAIHHVEVQDLGAPGGYIDMMMAKLADAAGIVPVKVGDVEVRDVRLASRDHATMAFGQWKIHLAEVVRRAPPRGWCSIDVGSDDARAVVRDALRPLATGGYVRGGR